jgi:hypothetical protein
VKTLEDWKIKIAVLWLIFEFCMFTIATVEFLLYHMEEMMVEAAAPEMMVVLVIVTLIPLLMAFLSLTLKDSINRWLNIIVGIVFIILMPIGGVVFPTAYLPAIILIAIAEVVALALIVWYAWKSKQKA